MNKTGSETKQKKSWTNRKNKEQRTRGLGDQRTKRPGDQKSRKKNKKSQTKSWKKTFLLLTLFFLQFWYCPFILLPFLVSFQPVLRFSCFFPTCQVRVVRFYVSTCPPPPLPLPSPPRLLLLCVLVLLHLFVPLLRPCESEFSVTRRILLRPCVFNVMCRASSAISWDQCSAPDPNRDAVGAVFRSDLNRDPVRAVFRAGPQPRACEISVPRRTSTAILWDQCSAPDLSREMCQKECQKICQKECQKICQKECQKMCQKECQKICLKEFQKICQKECQKICQKECQKTCQKICQKNVKRNVRRYARKNVKRYVPNTVGRYARRYVKRYVRKNVRRYVRKNVRRYVRKNVKRYVRKNVRRFVRKNSCLHQRNLLDGILCVAVCYLMWRTAANTAGSPFFVQASEFGLAAMAELVVERPATIFIGTANRFAKGVEHVWRYKLTFVGAERIYACMEPPSTTHAGDCMFIVPEVVEGSKWYVAYEGRSVPNAEGEQELHGEACCSLSHFGVVLGGWSARVGNKWCAEQRHLHRRGERATVARVGLHGLHTPWEIVAAPLPGLHLLDSTAFWRDGLMHVVCVCVCGTTGVLHLWT